MSGLKAIWPLLPLFAATTAWGCAQTNVFRVVRGADWVPIEYRKDIVPGSALDFSQMGLVDAPAGRHGWLKSVDGHFAFEDSPSVPRRFCGPNLCFDGCCPFDPDAEALADRLVRYGYNSIRIHNWETALSMGDSGWTVECDWGEFDPVKLDRFDRFMAACFKRGIYVTTDLYVSRIIQAKHLGNLMKDREPNHWADRTLYKSLVMVNDTAYANWCAFVRKFLTHRNPYTGRTYADEPGMPFLSLINENSLDGVWETLRKRPEVQSLWRDWLAEERTKDPSFMKDAPEDIAAKDLKLSPDSSAFQHFEAYLEERFFARASKFLRGELGVRALLTDQNNGRNRPPLQRVRERLYDYVDAHHYDAHPVYQGKEALECSDHDPTTVGWMGGVAQSFTRLSSKPFTLSEWDYAYPSRYRSAAGLMMGTGAAQQGCDARWSFCWDLSWNGTGKELRDGATVAPHCFDRLSDPLAVAMERTVSLLYLRADAHPFQEPGLSVVMTGDSFRREGGRAVQFNDIDLSLAWVHNVEQTVDAPSRPQWTSIPFGELCTMKKQGRLPMPPDPSAALRRNETNRYLTVVTERTCGGFAFPESGAVRAGSLGFRLRDSFAAVSASSIDREGTALADARRILVVHLTNLQAEGSAFADGTFRKLLKKGTAPLVANGAADIALRLNRDVPRKVYALDTSGRRLGEVPHVWDGRLLKFRASVRGEDGMARIHYEITE
ncbi:MAG: hypothetical protein KBT68_11690 [bacterium]|nr:hypothetical protein [Candidatus Colisoma equi]